MGITEQKIQASGIPFNSSFVKTQNRAQLAEKFGIDRNKFTVLLMTGSFGAGPLEEIAESLMPEAQVLVVCARNKMLFNRLQKRNLDNVKVFEFVNNAQELMAVSDVIITKPGGSSIAELLNMELLPIFIAAIPGQEYQNARVLANYAVGSVANNIREIKDLILNLKNNPQRREELKQKIREIQKPFACQELASVIR
jgi:processive 1,2-diacylglycerol beta-glucosyltransferase